MPAYVVYFEDQEGQRFAVQETGPSKKAVRRKAKEQLSPWEQVTDVILQKGGK
jgi:hypothetical protein